MKKNTRNPNPGAQRPEPGEPRGNQRRDSEEQIRARRDDEGPATPDGDPGLTSRDEEGEDEDEALERP